MNDWHKKGKTYQAKSFAALKTLYAPIAEIKPGHEPKGIRHAQPSQSCKPQEAESQKQKPNAV